MGFPCVLPGCSLVRLPDRSYASNPLGAAMVGVELRGALPIAARTTAPATAMAATAMVATGCWAVSHSHHRHAQPLRAADLGAYANEGDMEPRSGAADQIGQLICPC